jgi:hypothetical protein
VVAALAAGLLMTWVTRPEAGDAEALSAALRSSVQLTDAESTRVPSTAASRPAEPGASTSPSTGASMAAGQFPGAIATPATPAAPSAAVPSPPTRLVIDVVGLQMPLVPVGVAADGDMALPRSPAQAGWYRFGARPGDPEGATVIAGHLDEPWYGTGALARLDALVPGDTVVVDSGSTSRRFLVTEVQAVRKTRVDLAALFRADGPPSLHIVTCGGRFDSVHRRYDENVVVVARPAGGRLSD